MLAFGLGFACSVLLVPVPIVVIVVKRAFWSGIDLDS